ncbi:hypothetical protein Q9K01_00600 [Qipengyuania sp. DY56-A-20]|jgi:hypothetical protein|uniref:Secreted protein n=1 Tax=Qipengyuania benthica TaxID=3067651 RepID=A0ABT9H481_9SPHN|nr:hypothetical protein [Qipengyuania sp. DY56-A-20]MBU1253415.1 hypothetical protein [Alphaproteobacteria bacterium]MBU1605366.1 hypothetical protein [Alphaproteobacteria bacterium]MDP4538126.1 hypothetical protein [Qipengyuania sp. DY56-A-20]
MNKFFSVAILAGSALSLAACDVDQTEEGEMPEVSVEEGNMPEYDVEPVDVDVETGTETVEVPTLDVETTTPDAEGTPVTGDE